MLNRMCVVDTKMERDTGEKFEGTGSSFEEESDSNRRLREAWDPES